MSALESFLSFFRFSSAVPVAGGRVHSAVLPAPPPPFATPEAAHSADDVAAGRQALRDKIAGYGRLPPGWDGDNGRAPAQADINNALAFVAHIPDAGVATAEPMVAGDGDVGFEWDAPGHCLEVGFTDGKVSFFGDLPNGERLMGAAPCDQNAPPEKLRYLMDAIFAA